MVLLGALCGLLLATAAEACRVMLGNNLHTVLPGRVYRCAQLSGPALGQVLEAHHIRTVVNLRGCGAPFPWYLDECRATHALNAAQYDVCFSAGRLPSGSELRRLIEVLDRCEYPLVLHCRRGADRTGMAAGIVLLLEPGTDLDAARRQLGLRYGHVALGRPAYLDQFFDLYQEWLDGQGLTHAPRHFRRWAQTEYCPGACRCRVGPAQWPALVPRGKPFRVQVRFQNTSVKLWRFQPETNAGIHARYALWDDSDRQIGGARAGLFPAEVAPGHSIDLTLALPALHRPGRYRVLVDLVDEQQCWFFQTGSEPLETEFEVRE
jgi:hypothetical protein